MKHAQHAAHTAQIWKDGIIQTSAVVVLKIDGPAYMVEDRLEKSTHKNEQVDLGI